MKNIDRREFLRGSAAWALFAGCAPLWGRALADESVGLKWTGWKKGEFQVHFIYTGVAESQFLIFPDGTSMLLDCGDHNACERGELMIPILPSQDRHAGEWIARYVLRVNPNHDHVDYMLLTHFHDDHAGHEQFHAGKTQGHHPDYYLSGFAQAAEYLHFDKAIDRGWPDYKEPIPLDERFQGGVLKNMKALYANLRKRDGLKVEKFRLGASDQIVMRHGGESGDFSVFNFCGNGKFVDDRTGVVVDPYAWHIKKYHPRELNENGMSLGTLFRYGPFTYYTAGDFSDNLKRPDGKRRQTENDLAKVMKKVDVAKINHHGHKAMCKPLAKALDAKCYVACIWDQLHCTDDTMEALESTGSEHVYFPGFVPNRAVKLDGGKLRPWMKKVPECMFSGAHTVLTVQPGGKEYSMTCLAAQDESMRIVANMKFVTRT